ncbi:hypothetical protein D3C84_1039120 [compost metagenome]
MSACGFTSTAIANQTEPTSSFLSEIARIASIRIKAKNESTCPQPAELIQTAGFQIYSIDSPKAAR